MCVQIVCQIANDRGLFQCRDGAAGGGEMMFVSDQQFLFKRNTKEQRIFLKFLKMTVFS
jgi:hypothetical protein